MIGMGQGISLLPDMARRADNDKRRVYRPLADHKPQRTVGVIWRQRRYHSPTAERFLQRLRLLAAELHRPVR